MEPEENEQTRICSIVFLEIAQFSQQPSEVQFSWRIEMSMLLDRCLEGMEPGRRIDTDTSNGAAIAFLLSPEDALSFVQRIYNELPKLQKFALRVGVHLGPLRVVQSSSGRPGIAGEGVNAAQRAMRFAGANEVLVSRAFQEEIIRLAPGNAGLFSPHGKRPSKLGREHDLFRMGQQPAPSEPPAPPELSAPLTPSVPPAPASPEPSVPPEPSAPPESLSSSGRDAQDAGTTPPAAKAPGFRIKVALGVLLIIVAGNLLWVLSGSREQVQTQTASPAADAAVQDAPVPSDAPKVDDFPVAAQPEQASPAMQEEPRLTDATTSGKVAVAKKDPRGGSERCPNCSCTDLMTKLSLGSALNETERRYMTERCKK